LNKRNVQVFAIDYADQSFRTPSEVTSELRIPVLAAVPIHGTNGLSHSNGNGDGHTDDVIYGQTGTGGHIIQERG
jgi:hypothetical protein